MAYIPMNFYILQMYHKLLPTLGSLDSLIQEDG